MTLSTSCRDHETQPPDQARRQRRPSTRRSPRRSPRRPGQRRIRRRPKRGACRRGRAAGAGRAGGGRRRAPRRRTSNRCRTRSRPRSSPPATGARCAPTPSTASSTASCATRAHPGRRRGVDEGVPAAARLARQRQCQPGLFAGRADPQRVGQGDRQLLARPCVPARGRRRRTARPTSTSTTSTCSAAIAPAGRCARCCTKASTACRARWKPARPSTCRSAVGQIVNFLGTLQNEWAGAQAFSSFDTYLAPFIRQDRLSYDAGAPVHAGARLQPERALALGHADAVHQPHLRLGLPGRPARAGAGDRRPGNALQLRRAAGRDGPDQPRLHRGDDGRRRQGARLHLPDPHLQHHQGLRLDSPNADCCSR